MNPRQRNIPVTSKEEAEVQTEVKYPHLYSDLYPHIFSMINIGKENLEKHRILNSLMSTLKWEFYDHSQIMLYSANSVEQFESLNRANLIKQASQED